MEIEVEIEQVKALAMEIIDTIAEYQRSTGLGQENLVQALAAIILVKSIIENDTGIEYDVLVQEKRGYDA